MDSFGRTQVQAQPYLVQGSQEKPDIKIEVDWRALKEQQPHLSEDECEYISTGGDFYRQLLGFNGMLLHASAVVLDGKAYLFSAPSGTGKSTHTALWRRVFGEDRTKILNDDKPALRLEDGVFYAYGTPWSGKTDQNINTRVPLAGICILSRGEENIICPYKGQRAIHDILEQTIRPRDQRLTEKLLELLDRLLRTVPVWKMECNMDPQAALVAWEAMSADRKDQDL
ncbi:MAG: hypothetical protein J6A62_07880 [Oscillospiraceae bacterium]|nr:hypothetical protein [Oscillospiraceae bacterium]